MSADNKALLTTVGHRLVRAVAHECTPYADAMLAIVKQRQRSWPMDEWEAALKELRATDVTVADWLQAEHLRAKQ